MALRITARTVKGPLISKIREISGQDPSLCIQCGLCAGSCPMTSEMDLYIRKVMHLLQLGLVDVALSRKMAYLCASCHLCEVRCPRGIDIPRVVEALRLIMLRSGENYLPPESISGERIRELPQAAMVAGLRKFTG